MARKAKARKKVRNYFCQPRLKHGIRVSKSGAIHEAVLAGLKRIAADEKKSVSWVIHEIVAEFFGKDIMGDKL